MTTMAMTFVLAVVVLGPAAVATAAPTLSGKYAYSITSPCRASSARRRTATAT